MKVITCNLFPLLKKGLNMLSWQAQFFYTAFDKNLVDQETTNTYCPPWSAKNALSNLRQLSVH